MDKFDVIIIGSGLGGLLCANILSREGYQVCVLEKNQQFGGCLQTFKRDGSIFDTGMHYIGGMDKGKILNTFFDYLGLIGKLKLKRLDENGYDIIRYHDKEYRYAMGYQGFIDGLTHDFPDQYTALTNYSGKIREVGQTVDMCYALGKQDNPIKYLEYYGTGYNHFLHATISNDLLRNVLIGMSPVYAGIKEKTPLYIPMMIHSSYIEGAYRFIDGGSQLSSMLVQNIKDNGGTVLNRMDVTRILLDDSSKVKSVEVNGKEILEGRHFIANIHPKNLLDLIDKNSFKPAFVKRIGTLEETYGMFSLYLSSKDHGFKYMNRNYYCYHTDDLWNVGDYTDDTWPKGYLIHYSPVSESRDYTNSVIVHTYMKWKDLAPWIHTRTGNRGEDYEAFKQKKAEKLLGLLERDFPGFTRTMSSYHTSTPLTYRDYTGTYEGSAYGILKDYRNPFKTMILPKTHIVNLLLTGQNMNTHGVVGVTIGSLLTCAELLGRSYLLKKLCHA